MLAIKFLQDQPCREHTLAPTRTSRLKTEIAVATDVGYMDNSALIEKEYFKNEFKAKSGHVNSSLITNR